jgi:type I restriction enzyme M protein
MNMTLHGVDNPTIRYNNSLAEEFTDSDKYSLILANPPFSGSLDPSTVSKSLNQISGGTKSTELLFLSLFLRLLKVGGRCVSVIPVGVLNNTNEKAYTRLRRQIVEEQKLEAVIYMPNGVFQPYSGVQTGILVFTKTNSGGTDKVWLYNMEADGYSLDQKRDKTDADDTPDVITRWKNLAVECERTPFDKSFFVSKQDIVDNDYVLSFNKYHKVEIAKKEYRPTSDIIKSIRELETEFAAVMDEICKGIE